MICLPGLSITQTLAAQTLAAQTLAAQTLAAQTGAAQTLAAQTGAAQTLAVAADHSGDGSGNRAIFSEVEKKLYQVRQFCEKRHSSPRKHGRL